MKTKFFLATLILLLSIVTMQAVEINGINYNLYESTKTAEVTSNYGKYTGVIVIPESVTYEGIIYSVTSIESSAFFGYRGLTSITIPNSVTSIGDYAFSQCTELTSITIPNSVTSIGYNAFLGCRSLPIIDNIRYADTYLVEAVDKYLPTYNIKQGTKWIGDFAFEDCTNLKSIIIPNRVAFIGRKAFNKCIGLETLVLGKNVETINKGTFSNCERLIDIYLYAEKVPTLVMNDAQGEYEDCFYKVSRKAALWVPANRLRNYQIHEYWGEFDVQPMAAEGANVTDVVFTPQDNSAEMRWPMVDNAETYSLSIKDKQGTVICTLEFNSEGQLQSIVFAKPALNQETEQTEATGFKFTIVGLSEATLYDYLLEAKDGSNKVIKSYSGTFGTTGATVGLEEITSPEQLQEMLQNPNTRIYNLQGMDVTANRNRLPAGTYIMRNGHKTGKIIL